VRQVGEGDEADSLIAVRACANRVRNLPMKSSKMNKKQLDPTRLILGISRCLTADPAPDDYICDISGEIICTETETGSDGDKRLQNRRWLKT